MAIADNVPLINGEAYNYANIVVNILGSPIAGITAISYEQNREVTENFGAGAYPVSRSKGKIESSATITIDRAELNAIINASPLKNILDIPEFDITVSYLPTGSLPVSDVIKNCVFKKTMGGASEGDSNVLAELELAVSHIEYNV